MCRIDGSIKRVMARGFGETECLIFGDALGEALSRLRSFDTSIIASYPFINAHAALVHVHDIESIAGIGTVRAITGQSKVYTTNRLIAKQRVNPHSIKEASGVEEPLLEHNRYVRHEHTYCGITDVHQSGNLGHGVTIAVIDTGIIPHLDFVMPVDRIAAFVDFVDSGNSPYDNFGHGTAVASIACGNGLVGCREFCGVAPKANIIALRAIGDNGEGGAFKILEAMQWIIDNKERYNIGVVCMSFGAKPQQIDPLVIGAEALWDYGIAVVASCGNTGPDEGTIMSPAVSPKIISVGGLGRCRAGFYVPAFSSRGEAGDNTPKPDVVAPAVDVVACSTTDSFYSVESGTSMAAPFVAGICALLLEREPNYTPDKLKELIVTRAHKLPYDYTVCGSGLVQIQIPE